MSETEQPIVTVAALTYRRPEMLAQLLEALTTLEHPPGWTVRFLIVDNDPDGSARPIVERFVPDFGKGQLTYVVEPEPGIPAARNRALDEAISHGARLLAFIDDDEYPDEAWLCELVAHQVASGAALVGGPNLTCVPRRALTSWQRFLARSIEARALFMASNIERLARNGAFFVVSSGNWLADLNWLSEQDIWFDATYRESGGEDVAICQLILSRGGKVSWCPTAVIYEHLPPERLSLRTQFARHRQQAILMARLRPAPRWQTMLMQPMRMLAGIAFILIPIFGRASFMLGVYFIASGAGKISSVAGASSKMYVRECTSIPSGSK